MLKELRLSRILDSFGINNKQAIEGNSPILIFLPYSCRTKLQEEQTRNSCVGLEKQALEIIKPSKNFTSLSTTHAIGRNRLSLSETPTRNTSKET